MRKEATTKNELAEKDIISMGEDELCKFIESTLKDTEELLDEYRVVVQITNPSDEYVCKRLKSVVGITGVQFVTKTHDPNGLLDKEGGYSSCIYFSYKDVDQSEVNGASIVDKGTDAGGAVEIYSSLQDALNRCDYLSQFDGTLLYSGSYAVVGTMVVRTSYKLNDNQQVELTNDIVTKLTELE